MCYTVIIENTEDARDKHGYMWGCSFVQLTEEMVLALIDGKCVADSSTHEYVTFITIGEVK